MAAIEQDADKKLIERLRTSDPEAYKTLYRRFFKSVSHFIVNNSGSEEDAKDVFQEAVIVLHNQLKNNEFELSCKPGTYLYSVARFIWLKKLKKASLFTTLGDDEQDFVEVDDSEIDSERMDQLGKMQHSLVNLGEPCRTLIEDYYIRNLSMTQIAEKFGYTNPENAKNQKYKCMMRLKKLFFGIEYKL
jgi:RNA polymerase sigma factor (sigma-70 family)